MGNSFAQQFEFTCSMCGKMFDGDLWLIIDASERPDLIEFIRDDSLHQLTCPHCENIILDIVDTPLLLFSLHEGLPLLLSPGRLKDFQKTDQQVNNLVDLLSDNLGNRWQDKWLAHGIPSSPRDLLATLMDNLDKAVPLINEQLQL